MLEELWQLSQPAFCIFCCRFLQFYLLTLAGFQSVFSTQLFSEVVGGLTGLKILYMWLPVPFALRGKPLLSLTKICSCYSVFKAQVFKNNFQYLRWKFSCRLLQYSSRCCCLTGAANSTQVLAVWSLRVCPVGVWSFQIPSTSQSWASWNFNGCCTLPRLHR